MSAPPAFRCSVAAQVRGDSMVATAPPAQRWLLLEHPGPWPSRALDAFEPTLGHALAARADALHARVSLVRRPGRHPRDGGPFRWAFADVRRGHEGLRWSRAEHVEDVLTAAWEAQPGEGAPVALVCAHSRHDVCCALRGRPVAAALDEVWPGQVWECSHLGGDRFAATMVLLPDALCYGRVDPLVGGEILAAHLRREVVPDHLRGRCVDGRPAQAAQALARAHAWVGVGIDEAPPFGVAALGEDTWEVVLGGERPVQVVLREHVVPLDTPATCRATRPGVGYEHELVSITSLTAP